MKKALLALAAVAMAGSSFAQGTITFQYFALNSATESAILQSQGGPATDDTFSVALFKTSDLSTPLATTAIFGTTGLFQFSGTDVTVPGVAANQAAQLTLRVWKTSQGTFAAATHKGEFSFTSAPLGGQNPTPPPPALTSPDLSGGVGVGFKGGFLVPEPSTYALGIAGLGALAMMRRRK